MASDCFVDPTVLSYLSSLRPPLPDPLSAFEEDVRRRGLPVSSPETVNLLRVICALLRPSRILEIGTCVGFSACVMAHECPTVTVETVERNPVMIAEAKENIRRFCPDRITLWEGDAAQVLRDLSGEYDLIFLDAAKGQYPVFWDLCRPHLRPGGVLMADDVLFRGMVSDGKPDVHRNQTIVNRLRTFLTDLTSDPSFVTGILPISDGVAVAVRKGNEE